MCSGQEVLPWLPVARGIGSERSMPYVPFGVNPWFSVPRGGQGELAAAVGSVTDGYCVILVLTFLVVPDSCEYDKHACFFIYEVEHQAGPSEVHYISVIVKC